MPVTVVVGGQYGSEGKGKVCAHLASRGEADFVVRCGGPNSGHTVDVDGVVYELKQVPAGFLNPSTRLLLAAGSVISPALLLDEIKLCRLTAGRLGVDRNAAIIDDSDAGLELTHSLRERLGSTGVGMGAAVSRRVLRKADLRLASDVPELREYITCVQDELRVGLDLGASVLVEGTQGYGLSLYHTEQWPFCTSRDTTAHAFLSEVGIGARRFDVIMAIRTYPIRVGGNSGPLRNEISWPEVQRRSGYPHDLAEYTTTTKRLRRVALFDWDLVERAVAANEPNHLALHGLDYLDYRNLGASTLDQLTELSLGFVYQLERRFGVPVSFLGTGPLTNQLIEQRSTIRSLALAKSVAV